MSKKSLGLKAEPVPSVSGSEGASVPFSPASYTITIPDIPPSLNTLSRMHWTSQRRLTKKWTQWVWAELLVGRLRHPTADTRKSCKVTIWHSRLYDKDNAYGGCKPLVDALKQNRLIFDDTAEWLDLSVEQEKCSHKGRHTVIEIGEALA